TIWASFGDRPALPVVVLPGKPKWKSRLKTNEGRHSMITNQAGADQSKLGSEQEPTNIQRRTLIGGALDALLSPSGQVKAQAQENNLPNDPFIVLLKGRYQPVPMGQGPANNLGLTTVNLSDGSYSRTQIYPVWIGIPGSQNQDRAIGTFYVSLV